MRDSQKWKRVELRAAQQFSRKREKEDDPDIGLPVTYKGTLDEQRGDQGQAGEHHKAQMQGQEGPQGQVEAAKRGGVSVPQHHGQRGRGDHSPGP